MDSLKFTTGADDEEIKWHLKLHTENEESEDKSWMSVSLHYSSAQKFDVKAMYHLFIINIKNERVNITEFRKWFKNGTDSYIHAEFMKKVDLKEKKGELLLNDTQKIYIELTVYDDPTTYSNSITCQQTIEQ